MEDQTVTRLQDFRRRTTPETAPPRLAALRAAMRAAGVDAFLVPRTDAHRGETVAPCDERLAWLTSFTGSAGFAIAGLEAASLFVDGRYTLQSRIEVDENVIEILRHPEDSPAHWLRARLASGRRVGFDPWLHSAREIEALAADLESDEISLIACENLVDRVWEDRPPPPAQPIVPHPLALVGRSSADKRAALAEDLVKADRSAAVLNLNDSIAWLLNIRGSDIARTPVPRAFAILHADCRVTLFTDPARCDDALRAHLGPEVDIAEPGALGPALDALAGKVAVDNATAPCWVSDRLGAAGVAIDWAEDPCIRPKARKTDAEVAGARAAHLRDGAAMVRFLAWLEDEAPRGRLTEIDIVRKLEAFRCETGLLRDISFETICGAGPNGAIVHYRVSEASNRAVKPGEVLLVDSGGQYLDGTTDITRTVAVGDPPSEVRRSFTLVLKGLIAMSRLTWPEGLAGAHIDAVARAPLWRDGMDYDHGTGHGVGAYLGVHEGPQALSRRSQAIIEPGMILSIEPGTYREGVFGIRIENLAVVRPAEWAVGDKRRMLAFETLTLVPIDRRLIEVSLLETSELDWVNAYHAEVLAKISPLSSEEALSWLSAACSPL
jgi:Xaa-Pro aminopeptidase